LTAVFLEGYCYGRQGRARRCRRRPFRAIRAAV